VELKIGTETPALTEIVVHKAHERDLLAGIRRRPRSNSPCGHRSGSARTEWRWSCG